MGHKQRTPRRNIHIGRGLPEAGAVRIGIKCVREVCCPVFLIHQLECNLLLEGPGKEVVELALHDDEEQTDVGSLAHPVTIQVHLVENVDDLNNESESVLSLSI